MTGFCLDCERPVEVDQHGHCTKCGGASVIAQELRPMLKFEEVVTRMNDILSRLESTGKRGLAPLDEAAMYLIVARDSMMRGLTIDLFIENAISSWRAAMTLNSMESPQSTDEVKH